MHSEKTSSKKAIALAASAVILTGVAYILMANPEFRFMEGASAIKILWTRAILTGQGYTDIGRIGAPPEIVRPPGFALFLSGIVAVFGENMLALKVINNLFAPIGCAGLFIVFRRRTRKAWLAAGLALAGWLFPDLYQHAPYLEAEILFMALLFWAIFMFERQMEDKHRSWYGLSGFCVLLAVLVLVRSVAITLVPAAIISVLLKSGADNKKKAIWITAIVLTWVLVGGGWMVRNQMVAPPGELTYVDKLLSGEPIQSVWWLAEDHRVPLLPQPKQASISDVLYRLPQNAAYFSAQIFSNLNPLASSTSTGATVFGGILLLAAMAGLFISMFKRKELLDFFAVFYLVTVLLWPYQDKRFILPVAPALLYYLIYFVSFLHMKIKNNKELFHVRTSAPVILIILILFFIGDYGILKRELSADTSPSLKKSEYFVITTPNPGAYHSLVLLDYLGKNTGPQSSIMFHSYSPCALITGRQCSAIPMARPDDIMRYILDSGIDYVVVDDEAKYGGSYMSRFTVAYLKPVMEKYPGYFKPYYLLESGDSGIYQVEPE